MRSFASWWERFPARHVGSALVTALVLGFGFGTAGDFVFGLLRISGAYWT